MWMRFRPIIADVEEDLMTRLTVKGCELKLEICMRILTTACGSALARLERANRKLALRELDQYAECAGTAAGFMDVSEEVLRSLLDDDALVSESEYRRGAHSAAPGCIPCI